ncbi:hypothetical protein WA158_007670 [Blastocystis sp. Blastoise]
METKKTIGSTSDPQDKRLAMEIVVPPTTLGIKGPFRSNGYVHEVMWEAKIKVDREISRKQFINIVIKPTVPDIDGFIITGHVNITYKPLVEKSVVSQETNIFECDFKFVNRKDVGYRTRGKKELLDFYPFQEHGVILFIYISNVSFLDKTNIFSREPTSDPVGIYNQGTTCYINSIIQLLYHVSGFRRKIYELYKPNSIFSQFYKKRHVTSCKDIEIDTSLLKQRYEHEAQKHKSNESSSCGVSPVSPSSPLSKDMDIDTKVLLESEKKTTVLDELLDIFVCLQKGALPASTKGLTRAFGWTGMEVFNQHDVHELLYMLTNSIENEWKVFALEGEQNPMSTFEGYMYSYIKGIDIPYNSSKKEIFNSLQINVEGSTSLPLSLSLLTAAERLEGDNRLFIEGKGYSTCLKGEGIYIPPPVLMFQLKRFKYNALCNKMEKLNSYFEYPGELDLYPFLYRDDAPSPPPSPDYIYILTAVLVHKGRIDSGHYYIYIRKSIEGDKWIKIDDDTISEVGQREVYEGCFGSKENTSSYTEISIIDPAIYTHILTRESQAYESRIAGEFNKLQQTLYYTSFSKLPRSVPAGNRIFSGDSWSSHGFFRDSRIYEDDVLRAISKDTGIPVERQFLWSMIPSSCGGCKLDLPISPPYVPANMTVDEITCKCHNNMFYIQDTKGFPFDVKTNLYFFLYESVTRGNTTDLRIFSDLIMNKKDTVFNLKKCIQKNKKLLTTQAIHIYAITCISTNGCVELDDALSLEDCRIQNGDLFVFELHSNSLPAIYPTISHQIDVNIRSASPGELPDFSICVSNRSSIETVYSEIFSQLLKTIKTNKAKGILYDSKNNTIPQNDHYLRLFSGNEKKIIKEIFYDESESVGTSFFDIYVYPYTYIPLLYYEVIPVGIQDLDYGYLAYLRINNRNEEYNKKIYIKDTNIDGNKSEYTLDLVFSQLKSEYITSNMSLYLYTLSSLYTVEPINMNQSLFRYTDYSRGNQLYAQVLDVPRGYSRLCRGFPSMTVCEVIKRLLVLFGVDIIEEYKNSILPRKIADSELLMKSIDIYVNDQYIVYYMSPSNEISVFLEDGEELANKDKPLRSYTCMQWTNNNNNKGHNNKRKKIEENELLNCSNNNNNNNNNNNLVNNNNNNNLVNNNNNNNNNNNKRVLEEKQKRDEIDYGEASILLIPKNIYKQRKDKNILSIQ